VGDSCGLEAPQLRIVQVDDYARSRAGDASSGPPAATSERTKLLLLFDRLEQQQPHSRSLRPREFAASPPRDRTCDPPRETGELRADPSTPLPTRGREEPILATCAAKSDQTSQPKSFGRPLIYFRLTTGHRPPTTDHRPLTTDHRPLTTDHRPLTTRPAAAWPGRCAGHRAACSWWASAAPCAGRSISGGCRRSRRTASASRRRGRAVRC